MDISVYLLLSENEDIPLSSIGKKNLCFYGYTVYYICESCVIFLIKCNRSISLL